MWHPDEGTIHAWLDGALDAAEAARLEAHVATCAACAAAVAEARGLLAGASRVLAALDDVPGNVVPARPVAAPTAVAPAGHAVRARRRAPWPGRGAWRVAAGLLIVAGGSALVLRGGMGARQAEPLAAGVEYATDSTVATPTTTSVATAAAPVVAPVIAPMAAPAAAATRQAARERAEAFAARDMAAATRRLEDVSTARAAREEVSRLADAAPPPAAPATGSAAGGAAAPSAIATLAPAPARRLALVPPPDSVEVPRAEPLLVVGTVVDELTGRPVAGAAVTLDDGGAGTLGTLTDELGRFTIAGASEGIHRARVRRIGYTAVERPVRITRDSGAVVNLALSQATTELAAQSVVQEAAPASGERMAARRVRPGARAGDVAAKAAPMAAAPQSARAPWIATPRDACVLLSVRPSTADGRPAADALLPLGRRVLLRLEPEASLVAALDSGNVARFARAGDVADGTRASWRATMGGRTDAITVHWSGTGGGARLMLEWREGRVAGGGVVSPDGGAPQAVTVDGTRAACAWVR